MQVTKRRPKKTKLAVDSVSHFHMLVNENIRPTSHNHHHNNHRQHHHHRNSRSSQLLDNTSSMANDTMTLFSADLDSAKRETIKGAAAFSAAQLIISEKLSCSSSAGGNNNPEVTKSLRMYRPPGKKLAVPVMPALPAMPTRLPTPPPAPCNGLVGGTVVVGSPPVMTVPQPRVPPRVPPIVVVRRRDERLLAEDRKFAPPLSTLNLNPKIALMRVDEIEKTMTEQELREERLREQQLVVSASELSQELRLLQRSLPFPAGAGGAFVKFASRQKTGLVSSCVLGWWGSARLGW